MNWYYNLLAQRPHLVLIAVGVFSIACFIVSLTARKLPTFHEPTLGFEARGTSIGKRLTAWKNLLDETRASGFLTVNPDFPEFLYSSIDIPQKQGKTHFKYDQKKKKKKKRIHFNKKLKLINDFDTNKTNYDMINFEDYENNDTFSNRHEHWDYGKNLSYTFDEATNKKLQLKKNQWKSLLDLNPPPLTTDRHKSDGVFCESPNKEYAHFVVQRINTDINESLYEIRALLAICELEQRLTQINLYDDICTKAVKSNDCCRIWSLPNYIALLSNKSTCFQIDQYDVLQVKTLLLECFQYYHNLKLSNDCTQTKCRVPVECAQHNAVYNILHYLTDIDFIKTNNTNIFLNASMTFLPIPRSIQTLPFYHNIMKVSLSNEFVSIVAMDMGLKNALFDECLLTDGWLVGLGGIFVLTCMWIYTSSIFVTIMTITAVSFSLGIAYFIYTLIYEMTFFPFMNLLAGIVVVGIGADDAFIFVKIWQCVVFDRVKSSGVPLTSTSSFCSDLSRSDTLAGLMADTLRHASISMLVTSLTTAAAFFASYISSITAVRCFGIFAGTAVITNYFLMVTWLPAAVSIAERMTCFSTTFLKIISDKLYFPFKNISQFGQIIEETIISAVVNYSKIWIFVFGFIGVVSGVLVLYWPKLRLPDSPDFQLFVSSHPFEVYDSKFKDFFWFEKAYTSIENFKLPLRFVWGVQPIDKGNFLNPVSRGELILDDNFNISLPESQVWLLNFCKRLKNQTFSEVSFGLFLPNCFIENFISWMERRCIDEMSDIDRTPCCETSHFPFSSEIFNECLPQSISSLYETPREFFIPGLAGPKFSKFSLNNNPSIKNSNTNINITNNKMLPLVKALVVEYDSTQSFTMSYTEIEKFVNKLENWMKSELLTAPSEMKNGWFISELEFYDLQDTLTNGTLIAICMSMCVALIVLLLVTLNILISLYAIITVTFTILSTVSVLILLGWKLNVLESVAVSVTIGLAVDFSLHYGVQYRLSPELDRLSSTKFSMSRMIGPTSMAAITTGAAGGFMLPSQVLPYIQIGIFLLVVMTISWFYSTFFLMSLLKEIGPQYGFGQFHYPKFRNSRENKNVKNQMDCNKRIKDNQCLSASSSAAGDLVNSESHELDALTSNAIIKPLNTLECVRPINFERAFKKKITYPKDNSPSTVSAITVVMPDDSDTILY